MSAASENHTDHIARLKAQLAQLDALVAEGVLTGEAARKSRDALEAQVLAAVMQGEGAVTAAAATVRPPRSLVAGLMVFVLAFGLAGYAWKGNHGGWQVGPGDSVEAAAGADADPATQQAQIQAMVTRLEENLKTTPDDAEGWSMLARSYGVMGRYADAVAAFKRVMDLKPQDAQNLADYADALAMVNNRTLDGEPEKLIARAVQLDPSNVKALALAGTVAFNRSDYTTAIGYWEKAVQGAGPDSGYAQQLQGALAEARQRVGQAPAGAASSASSAATVAAAPAASSGAAATQASITGRVSLQDKLKAQVGPDDTVFIFARAPSGSRMPLAIIRKKVSDLPLDFTLDDSLAMSPAARLSSASQVIVGARISKTGNAMPSPGDWQALSAPVAVGASGLKLEIGEPVQ